MNIPNTPATTATCSINGGAVIGAGIAMNFASASIRVMVVETSQDALERGHGVVRNNYAGTVAKGRLDQGAMDERMALIKGALDLAAVKDADIVVEAVFEEMAI